MIQKKKWNTIREIGICNKTWDNQNNHSAIDINDLIGKFSNIPSPVIPSNYYEDYTPPHAIGLDNIRPFFLIYILPKLLSYLVQI